MKFRYDKTDDILMVWFSQKPVDYAEQTRDVVVHFSKDSKPVLLEILSASKFLLESSRLLPSTIRRQVAA